MTNAEVHKLVNKSIESYANSTNTVFLSEINEVRKEVKEIKDEFKAQNGRLRDVCEWKASVEGGKNAINELKRNRLSNMQIFGIIIAGVVGLITVLGFIRTTSNQRELNELNYKMYLKEDKDPIVRSLPDTFGRYQDSIELQWYQKKYNIEDTIF